MESEPLDSDAVDRPRGILTEADRKYLVATEQERENNYSRQAQNLRKREIRKRLRHALRDFQLIESELPSDIVDDIFDVPPHAKSEERGELQKDIGHVLQFLYVAMGGQSWFRKVLSTAVANGEKRLGNADHALMVQPRFEVSVRTSTDLGELATQAVDKLDQDKTLKELEDEELYALSVFLDLAGGIDTDRVRNAVELKDQIMRDDGDTDKID